MIWDVQSHGQGAQLLGLLCARGGTVFLLCPPPVPLWNGASLDLKVCFCCLAQISKIISYSSAFIHRHLHWHSCSQTCIYTPIHTHTHTLTLTLMHTNYPEIGLLATWFGLNVVEKAAWSYQLVTCFSKIPPLIIYSFGSPQLRIKYFWSRQHTIKLSSNILAGSHSAQGTSPSLAGWL